MFQRIIAGIIVATVAVCAWNVDATPSSSSGGNDPTRPIELWRLNGPTLVFVNNHSSGANIAINSGTGGLGTYGIRDYRALGALNDPIADLGIVEVYMPDEIGDVTVVLAENLNDTGMQYAGVVNFKGIYKLNSPNVKATMRGYVFGDLIGGNTGTPNGEDIQVHSINGDFYVNGDILDDVWIQTTGSIVAIRARSIGGGARIECLGSTGTGDITTIQAGWPTLGDDTTNTQWGQPKTQLSSGPIRFLARTSQISGHCLQCLWMQMCLAKSLQFGRALQQIHRPD